jgi:hypothetical protein
MMGKVLRADKKSLAPLEYPLLSIRLGGAAPLLLIRQPASSVGAGAHEILFLIFI